MSARNPTRVAYLVGAGGSHACVKAVGSATGILMSDLAPDLVKGVRSLVKSKAEYAALAGVVNEIVEENADFEHLITFFDESPSSLHQEFADGLRAVFEDVLRSKLQDIELELGRSRVSLYAALLDMYNVKGISESLTGILTLNYDDYIEVAAAEVFGADHLDLEFPSASKSDNAWPLLKLHGSLAWEDAWPIRRRRIGSDSKPLWIPPGIHKGKDRYPFNLLWGLARDVLNCDVLRVIGCRLGPSDWDLISLLFGTRHANEERTLPYSIEIIDSPKHAISLQQTYPYLNVKSLFEIETFKIGRSFVAEYLDGHPRRYETLSDEETRQLVEAIDKRGAQNWFQRWLVEMYEGLHTRLGLEATETDSGAFARWLGA